MIKLLLPLIIFYGCINNQKLAIKSLKKQGYTNIYIFNYQGYTCSLSDIYSIGFTGKNKQNIIDSGFVYKKHKNSTVFKIIID